MGNGELSMKNHYRIAGIFLVNLLAGAVSLAAIWEREALNGQIAQAVISEDGRQVAYQFIDGRVLLRSLADSEPAVMHSSAPYALTQLALSADGSVAVWADTSGRLHRYTKAEGLQSVQLGEAALTGFALGSDTGLVCVAGDGTTAWLRTQANLGSQATRNLEIEQVCAIAADATGDSFALIDHAGNLRKISADSSALTSRQLTTQTPQGMRHVDMAGIEWLVWDAEGVVHFLDTSFKPVESRQTGWLAISACYVDRRAQSILLGNRSGGIYTIDAGGSGLSELQQVAALPTAVIGLGANADGDWIAITAQGAHYRNGAAGFELVAAPSVLGSITQLHANLLTGVGSIVTQSGGWAVDLATGDSQPLPVPEAQLLLDTVLFEGLQGRGRVYLLMDSATHTLQLQGATLLRSYPIDSDWTPCKLLAASWHPRIALIAATGATRILEEQADGWVELARTTSTGMLDWDAYRFNSDETALVHDAGTTGEGLAALNGPFHYTLKPTGSLSFERAAGAQAFVVWPQLTPTAGGGMDAGYFGNIMALQENWFLHGAYGWGHYATTPSAHWFWFADEGWLAGAAELGSYLYAEATADWIYSLAALYQTDWIYDYSRAGWRRFGDGADAPFAVASPVN